METSSELKVGPFPARVEDGPGSAYAQLLYTDPRYGDIQFQRHAGGTFDARQYHRGGGMSERMDVSDMEGAGGQRALRAGPRKGAGLRRSHAAAPQ
jgi:hypothetical protein